MKLLFLTHIPQADDCRKVYARQHHARIKILPFHKLISLAKRYPQLNKFYIKISFIYSFFIHVKEDIIIADGGSSLCTAFYLKKRYRKVKLIYLDNDLLFYNLYKGDRFYRKGMIHFIKEIDGVISESNQSKRFSSFFLDVPIKVCADYPNSVRRRITVRKNYGLYVGRLDPDKNIKRILRFGLQCPYFERFIVIGDGVLKNYVKEISKKHDKIIYQGRKSNVEDYYSKCKFLVHIPDFDPHPRTTMEATLCGCFPIISVGVGTKYLFDNLFVIDDPDNFADINRRIDYILKHEARAKLLLQKSLFRIPTKKETLKNFRNTIDNLIKQID